MKSADKRLEEIYKKVAASVTDEHGYGGNVLHIAHVGGYQLQLTTTDFGDVLFGAGKPGERIWHLFELTPGGTWWPVTKRTSRSDLERLAALAEQAAWVDKLERGNDGQGHEDQESGTDDSSPVG